MKKKPNGKPRRRNSDDLRPEYELDYRKARPNRFAGRMKENQLVVVLDEDIARVFTTPKSVNDVLRALITAMPKKSPRKNRKLAAQE